MVPLKTILVLINLMWCYSIMCQNKETVSDLMKYDANMEFPYGRPNTSAPNEIRDYERMIGTCHCKSLQYRNGIAGDTLPLVWKWKYILNGYAVQDEGWFGDGKKVKSSFTSIRIYNQEKKLWMVPFFMPQMSKEPQIWYGRKEGDEIVLRMPIQSQDSMEMESVLTFSNITDKSFYWEAKIYNAQKNISNIFWKIWCQKAISR